MDETKIRLIGAGGHGILTLGRIIGETAVKNGMEAIMTIGYSPARRGGWSRADLILSDEKIDYPIFTESNILITTTQETYDLEHRNVMEGGLIIYESSLVNPKIVNDVRQVGVQAFENALKLGNRVVANIIILGFVNTILKLFPDEALLEVIKSRVKARYRDLNLRAYNVGRRIAMDMVGVV